jgi:prepilin-type N-terminal cleavage/methylation domain-containing protein
MTCKKNIGFNLLEIMIVIAILASIVTFAIVKYNEYTMKAGMVSIANYSKTMQDKLVLYYDNNDRLPNTIQAAAFLTTGLSTELEGTLGEYIRSTEGFNGFNENGSLNLDRLPQGLQTQLGDLTQIEELFCVIITLDVRCRSVLNSDAMYYSVSVKKTGQDLTTINYSTGVKPSCVVPNSSFICREGYICNPSSGEPDPNTCADGYLRIDTSCNLCPLGAVCSGGAITGCRSGFSLISGACTCSTGYVTGTGTDAVCHPCPDHANCSGGNIISCQSGYYGAICELPCQGVVSAWPPGICTPCPISTPYWDGANCVACPISTPYWNGTSCVACPISTPYWDGTNCAACSGSTPYWNGANCVACSGNTPYWNGTNCVACSGSTSYWNGTSCAACPAGDTCRGGAITVCGNGFSLVDGTCVCLGLGVITRNTLNNTTVCHSQCPWGSSFEGTGETVGVSDCKCWTSGLAADLRNQSCTVSCHSLQPMYVISARIENRVDQVRSRRAGYCDWGGCSGCQAWGFYNNRSHPDGRSCICG